MADECNYNCDEDRTSSPSLAKSAERIEGETMMSDLEDRSTRALANTRTAPRETRAGRVAAEVRPVVRMERVMDRDIVRDGKGCSEEIGLGVEYVRVLDQIPIARAVVRVPRQYHLSSCFSN